MRTALRLLRFFVQVAAAFVTGVIYYLVAMAPAVLDGAESFVGQPIVGIMLSIVAVGASLILGLPIRFVPALHAWWLRFWWLAILQGVVAVLLTVLSWLPRFQMMITYDPDHHTEGVCFNLWLGYAGWLLAIFCTLHFYPPVPLDRIADFLSRLIGRILNRPDDMKQAAATVSDP